MIGLIESPLPEERMNIMLIKDLIKLLADFDENQEIFVYDDYHDSYKDIITFVKDPEGDPTIVVD